MQKSLAVCKFLCKTVFFSPVNNPSLLLLLITGCLLFCAGGLGKHEILLLMLLITVSNRFISSVNSSSENSITLLKQLSLFPVTEIQAATGYICAAFFYGFVLFCLCFVAGLIVETPPLFQSITPTRMNSTKSPDGDKLVFVEGITLTINPCSVNSLRTSNSESSVFVDGVTMKPDILLSRIPLSPSLFFNVLSENPIFVRTENTDSLLCEFGGDINKPISYDLINPVKKPEQYFSSPFLMKLSRIQFNNLLIISLILFTCFISDAIFRYQKKRSALTEIIDRVFFISYWFFVVGAICDVLLPASFIWKVQSLTEKYDEIVLSIWIIIMVLGLIRVKLFLSIKNTGYAE